jgi:hypothetical protein
VARGAVRAAWPVALALGLGVASGARAQSAAVRVPSCTPAHIDVPLFAALLPLELELAGWIVDVGAELCTPGAPIPVFYVDGSHHMVSETITIPPGLDPVTSARVLALAIAERVPAPSPVAEPPSLETTEPSAADAAAPPVEASEGVVEPPIDGAGATESAPLAETPVEATVASTEAAASDAALPSDAAVTSEGAARLELGAPAPATSDRASRWLFGGGIRGRLARPLPVSDVPGWAAGGQLAATIPVDPLWDVRVELLAADSHSTTDNSFAITTAVAGALELLPFRDDVVEIVLAPRIEVGITGVFAFNNDPIRMWLAVGGEAGLRLWLLDAMGITVMLGGAGVLVGGPIIEVAGEVQVTVLDLSPVFADLALGFVVPL